MKEIQVSSKVNWEIYRISDSNIIPVVVQDSESGKVLLLAYVNKESLKQTFETGLATFWSRARNEIWIKGLTSGSILKIVDIYINCDNSSLLFFVKTEKDKGYCHEKDEFGKHRQGCFYRKLKQ